MPGAGQQKIVSFSKLTPKSELSLLPGRERPWYALTLGRVNTALKTLR